MQDNEVPEVKKIVSVCRSLSADALVLEEADHATVVALNVYDGTYAAASCDPGARFSAVARSLQVRLYSRHEAPSPVAFLPVATVQAALDGWERQIAVVFGQRYAARLVAGAAGAKAAGKVTRDDLERIRLELSSLIGGCLQLEKVDK